MPYSCEQIEGSILFNFDSIRCSCSNAGGIMFYENFNREMSLDFEKIFERKNKIIQDFQNNIAPECCPECSYLKSVNSFDLAVSKVFKKIYISNWRHCNCGCVYCDYRNVTKSKFSPRKRASKYYDVLPILKQMADKNMIDENTEFIFLGGECAVLKEFDEIVDFIEPIIKKRVLIYTSAVQCSNSIKNLLAKDKCMVVTSLDCGSPETYKKIKRIDAFDDVINTMKEYKKSAGENFKHVTLKYILLPKINDNTDEIGKFLKVVRSLGVQNTFLELDHRVELARKHTKIPEHFKDLFLFFDENTKDLYTGDCDHNKQMLEKGFVF